MTGTITRNARGAAVFFALTVNTVAWCLPLFVLAAFKLVIPHRGFRRTLTRMLMGIGANWVSGNAAILGLGKPGFPDVRGLEGLDRRSWYLVIANHQTWVDIFVLQTVFNRRIPFLKFFIKQELIWFPFLGIAWWALDMPFMKRHSKSYLAKHPHRKGLDLEATQAACRKFRETPTSVINFVEGTRFSEAKREARGSPFDHLLPPRAGGVAYVLAAMGDMFDAILDVTVVYPCGAAGFWQLCRGEVDRVIVDIEPRPLEDWLLQGDYVNDREFRSAFHRWLSGLWKEKDARIAALKSEVRQGVDCSRR